MDFSNGAVRDGVTVNALPRNSHIARQLRKGNCRRRAAHEHARTIVGIPIGKVSFLGRSHQKWFILGALVVVYTDRISSTAVVAINLKRCRVAIWPRARADIGIIKRTLKGRPRVSYICCYPRAPLRRVGFLVARLTACRRCGIGKLHHTISAVCYTCVWAESHRWQIASR